ncbi:MAG: type I polyketide synthase [Rhizobacter sp.]
MKSADQSVAIVGIGCRFPGGVTDPASFWQLLSTGVDAITEVPASRIDLARFFDPRPATPGHMMSRRGGFLDRMEEFDAEFFGISPREAQYIDPQQRVLLEAAWEALEDAGQDVLRLEGSSTAVYVGQWVSDFESRLFANPDAIDFPATLGSGRYASSGRISYVFGFRGPSLTIDSACSSSLATVHLAVRSLRSGETRLALAGGVNMILQPHITIGYSQSRMMAADGHCKFGDASGDGYVRSEGAGLVALKLLDQAVADGDRIYAVIRGSAVNNDGRSSGVMGRPSRIGHEEMLRAAYNDAGVSASRVSYVEAHGTGTRAGDPVEIAALGAVLGEGRLQASRCLIGSVKTNIGHTEGAAGIAGLIKTALSLHHAAVPASLHFVEPNPSVPWSDLPFQIPTALSTWPSTAGPKLAGVNSFGIGGTNAHVVLEEAPRPVAQEASPAPAASLLLLSAKSPEALRALAGRHADALGAQGAPALHDICWTAATRRAALEYRQGFVAADAAAMVEALRQHAAGDTQAVKVDAAGGRPKLAFIVPGQGAQWEGMARELVAKEPVFRDALERCDRAVRPFVEWSILDQLQLEPGSPGYGLDRIDVVQPVLVSLAIAYAALWKSWGVEPDAVVGHSMGEVGAACIAGALSLEQAMQIICRRSALMRRTSGRGAMALVELSMEAARERLRGREDRVSVAVSNSPRSSVISGEPDAVREVMLELERDQVFCRLVKVDVASHSPQMEPLAQELARELEALSPAAAQTSLYSTVWARRAEGAELLAEYWAHNLRRPVLFAQTLERMLDDGLSVFIELGPHPVVLPSVQQTAQAVGHTVTTLGCGQRDEAQRVSLLTSAAGLWAAGAQIQWQHLMPEGGRVVALPSYPWQRERHWADAAELPQAGVAMGSRSSRPDEESLAWLHSLKWEVSDPAPSADAKPTVNPDTNPIAASAGRWLIATLQAAAGDALAVALKAAGADARAVPLADLETALASAEAHHLVVLSAGDPHAPYLPVRAAQAVLARPAALRAKLWFVTSAAQAVVAGERVNAQQGALWGSARVVAEEHPELWGGLIDLAAGSNVAETAGLLAHHLLAADSEDQVAMRGRYRHVLRLIPRVQKRQAAPFAWRADAAYLITGGLGGVALHIARAMVSSGARRLVLMGRTALPSRDTWSQLDPASAAGQRVAAVRELEALGAAVHLATVDVADEAALRACLQAYEAQAWPPIRGVVHAAGAFDNHLASAMSAQAFDAVLAPKLHGAQWLDKLLPDLDLFVLFSSTGAFLAQAGQANYAAANAGLDALAMDRHARGLPAISVAWGVWADTGLVRGDAGERNVAEMARQGIRAFAPEKAAALFPWLCARTEAHVAVLPMDWAAFRRVRAGRADALYRELTASAAPAALPASGLNEQLAKATPAERRLLLEAVVKDAVGQVLKIAAARLDPRKALGAMGLNSLMAMELRNRLEAALGRSLSATLAWNYPTVEALAAHLAGGDVVAPPVHAASPTPAAPSSAAVAALSDAEAALALRGAGRRGAR